MSTDIRSMYIHSLGICLCILCCGCFIDYFHWYELFISGVKLVLLFTVSLFPNVSIVLNSLLFISDHIWHR